MSFDDGGGGGGGFFCLIGRVGGGGGGGGNLQWKLSVKSEKECPGNPHTKRT